MNFPRSPGLPGQQPQQPQDPNEANIKMMAGMMESCYAKTVMAGVAGMGLGAVFGMFMASVSLYLLRLFLSPVSQVQRQQSARFVATDAKEPTRQMAYDTPYHTVTPESTAAKPAAGAATTTPGSAPAAATKPHPAVPNATPGATTTTTTTASAAKLAVAPPPVAAAVKPPSAILPRVAAAEATAAAAAAASSSSAATAATVAAATTTTAAVTPMGAAAAAASGSVPVSSLPLRRQLAVGFKDMGARSLSTGKNFAKVGALFSGIECGIEGLRAKNDAANGIGAGCIAGAVLARNGGPQAAAIGCVGFAAFSAAIEAWLRSPKDE
ncbi:hypothetical protein RB594_008242 [Gaeumannomyces avenae]